MSGSNKSSPLSDSHSSPAGVLRTRLAEIDAEITELQARLSHLAVTRKPLADALESIVYPILTLPPEITAEIFIHYCALSPWTILHESRSGPLLLANICRTWRGIAINLRSIWSSIQISIRQESIASTEKLLQCWLPRAGGHPLDLDLDRRGEADRLLPLLTPYSIQWRSFSCSLRLPMSFTIDDIRGHIPLLRKLTVILESGSHMDYATPPITAFLDAPQIRDVTLVAISLRWISLPWAQLTHLNLRELSTAQCAKILQVTPRLESLSVIVRGSPSDEPFPLVRLDHLHTFKSPYMADLRLLDYIVGPALKHLDIPMLVGEGISHLLAFLVRSGCRLSSISLAHFTHSQAISALEVVATVNEIFLHFINWPRAELASFFTRIATDSHFLPNLETLSLEEPSSILPYVELCEMLESRWHGRNHEAARLKSFRIRRVLYRTLELKPAISRRLQALVDDGLRIDI